MNIIFMGTPDFAVNALKKLTEDGHTVQAVITGEDKPKGRGHKTVSPPVKLAAGELGIPVFQPRKLSEPEVVSTLKEFAPDVIVVVAYGKLLPQSILDIPKFGCLNIHASLLPKYRGAAPIQWAVINGEITTGITIMQMDAGLDTGDILLQIHEEVYHNDTSEILFERLSLSGAKAISIALEKLEKGELNPQKQDDIKSSYAPMLTKSMSDIDWRKPAVEIRNRIRGLIPWPIAHTGLDGKRLRIFEAELVPEVSGQPGEVVDHKNLIVCCGDGNALRLTEVQLEGGKRMSASAFTNGHPIESGIRLT